MSDKMRPLSFPVLFHQVLEEYRENGTVYGVPVKRKYKKSPIGPAAGPHTQLCENLISAYGAGASHFELKTVQVLYGDDLGIKKPCIDVDGEAYNTEWSSELEPEKAMEEYIKAYLMIWVLSKEAEFDDFKDQRFYMSVGYDYEGITSQTIRAFINGLKHGTDTRIWKECIQYIQTHLEELHHIEQNDLKQLSGVVSDTVIISTMHGCPADEIEKIAKYLMKEQQLNVYIKCNPTLLGYERARQILDHMSYGYMKLQQSTFDHDITYPKLVDLIRHMRELAEKENRFFGVKLTNTFPMVNEKKKLAGEMVYMSGPALYPLTIQVAFMLAKEFAGALPISYSGGADSNNIKDLLATGIYPVTVSTLLLKQGGYKNLTRLNDLIETDYERSTIAVDALVNLSEKSLADGHYCKKETKKTILTNKEYQSLCSTCRNCVDVCPNRANVRIQVENEQYVIHLDWLCNECGNCNNFCIMGHCPYEEKFTVFNNQEDFQNSTNEGILITEDRYYLRKAAEIEGLPVGFLTSIKGVIG